MAWVVFPSQLDPDPCDEFMVCGTSIVRNTADRFRSDSDPLAPGFEGWRESLSLTARVSDVQARVHTFGGAEPSMHGQSHGNAGDQYHETRDRVTAHVPCPGEGTYNTGVCDHPVHLGDHNCIV